MQQLIEAAKRVLLKLGEIQPAVSVAGLEYESGLLREIKKDLAVVVFGVLPDPVVVERVLDSQLVDVLGSMDYFLATLEDLGKLDRATLRKDERFEALLRLAMCSAENFADRTGDFLSSKQSFKQLFGGDYATN
ncbi:MAG: hypothetical protein KJ630_01320 [Proteobacteria bacterium]|nr:hypothetical protein [Pseudomonadota bacterium]